MKYQITEKEIYSESDLLHFGERYEMGEIVNEHFPDYSGVHLGDMIFGSTEIDLVNSKKDQLEITRLRTLNEMLIAFFDDDELADKFYTSEDFSKLQELYLNEYNLELIRSCHNKMEVKNNSFYIPSNANDEQILQIQKLLSLYFFEIQTED